MNDGDTVYYVNSSRRDLEITPLTVISATMARDPRTGFQTLLTSVNVCESMWGAENRQNAIRAERAEESRRQSEKPAKKTARRARRQITEEPDWAATGY